VSGRACDVCLSRCACVWRCAVLCVGCGHVRGAASGGMARGGPGRPVGACKRLGGSGGVTGGGAGACGGAGV